MNNKFDFQRAARDEVIREGFLPDFPPPVLAEARNAQAPAISTTARRDLRHLLWSSIDNSDSRDLDQAEWTERLPGEAIRVLVGIADVDVVVTRQSAIDNHAQANATSIYTGGPVFPMLPERLSTDLTSLVQDADRLAVVMEFVVATNGEVTASDVYAAVIRNRAKLSYNQVAAWLETPSSIPSAPEGLREQLLLQAEASRRLREFRQNHGALVFDDSEYMPVVVNGGVQRMECEKENPARDIIESFMVAANVSIARFLRARQSPCLRRVVRTPKRWDRIQAIAAQAGTTLPATADAKALGDFLARQKQADPLHFPELSLAVLKSLGPGEYIVEHPGSEHEGHFGLAVDDYTHSTAPNRRYADLLLQRLLKACLGQRTMPYTESELTALAAHCTEREAAARHVERFMKKVAAAMLLAPKIGTMFDAIVTGATPKGTFARLLTVPAEGRIMRGERGLDVGEKIRVRLVGVNAEKGFIDLEAAAAAS